MAPCEERGNGVSRWWLLLPLLAVLVALGVRLVVADRAFAGDIVPLGPDADDWAAGLSSFLEGRPALLQAHRFPLVPALAAVMVRIGLATSANALWLLSMVAGAVTVGVTWAVARRFLGPLGALAPALWIAWCPGLVRLSNQATAYGFAALAFSLVVLALLSERGRWAPWLAGLGSLLLVASLHQGLLELLVILPVALMLRRYRVLLAALGGLGLGLGLVYLLHPGPHDPVHWLLQELVRYLSGNVAEETQADGSSYAVAWSRWALQAFDLPGPWVLGGGAAAAVGLVWGAVPRPGRVPRLALVWIIAPAFVLCPLMASVHHLAHLLPLMAVALFVGLIGPLPRRVGPLVGLVVLGAMVAGSAPQLGQTVRYLRGQRAEVADQRRVVEAVKTALPEGGLVLYLDPPSRERYDVLETARWAMPPRVELVRVAPEDPSHALRSLRAAQAAGRPVVLAASPALPPPWSVGPIGLEPTGVPVVIDLQAARTGRAFWPVQAGAVVGTVEPTGLEGRGRMPWRLEQMVSTRGQAAEAPVGEDLARLRSLPPEAGDVLIRRVPTRGEARDPGALGPPVPRLVWPPASGSLRAEGAYDPDDARGVLGTLGDQLLRCELAWPWPATAPPGTMLLALELQQEGRVRLVRILEGALPRPELERCVAAVIATPDYPAPARVPTVLLVPVVFELAADEAHTP